MPRARSTSRVLLPGGALVLVALLGAVLAWRLGLVRARESPEPFQTYVNLSGFSKEDVWAAYRFAVVNPSNVLRYIPCFCGCVGHGDRNNRDCYLEGFDREGRPIYDPHAAG